MATSTEFTKLVSQAQRQAIESLTQAGELSLRAAEAATGLVAGNGTRNAPTPQQVVEAGFSFASQVLDVQKTYALRLADILTGAAAESTKKQS